MQIRANLATRGSPKPVSLTWLFKIGRAFDLCLLIIPSVSFGHCIICRTSIYAFWLPLWYHLAIVSSVLLWFVPSDYPFGIFWPLYRLSFFDLCLLITTLVSFAHCIVCPTLIYAFWLCLRYLLAIVSSVLLRLMPSDYPFGIFWPRREVVLIMLRQPVKTLTAPLWGTVVVVIVWQLDLQLSV